MFADVNINSRKIVKDTPKIYFLLMWIYIYSLM